MAHGLQNILQSSISAKNLDFFIDSVDVEHEDIICDKLRVNQILLNIASNAIKYTEPGGTITVDSIPGVGSEFIVNLRFRTIVFRSRMAIEENDPDHYSYCL